VLRAAGLAVLVALVAAPGSRAATPECFGAAVRAYVDPCHDKRLRYMVQPRPAIAQITPNAPCTRVRTFGPVHPCAFGFPRRKARARIALIGDSHASHWRAALEVAAQARHWYGLSVASIVCPVSAVIYSVQPESTVADCRRWNRAVLTWLQRRPQITTVFQSQIVSQDLAFATQVQGYLDVWKAFPRTVRRIIVIRDDPKTHWWSWRCVLRARNAHRRPGVACAESRAWALRPDPLAAAARAARSRRVQVIDLTHFMCGRRRCFPVVGGALVHKDPTHLTRVFATTLGPYLLRRLKQ
jgi:hypothetical protein